MSVGQWPEPQSHFPLSAALSQTPGPAGCLVLGWRGPVSLVVRTPTPASWRHWELIRTPGCPAGFQLLLVLPIFKCVLVPYSLSCRFQAGAFQAPHPDVKKTVLCPSRPALPVMLLQWVQQRWQEKLEASPTLRGPTGSFESPHKCCIDCNNKSHSHCLNSYYAKDQKTIDIYNDKRTIG